LVRGTLTDSLDWTTPGETYSLDGRVLVTNGAVLQIGSGVAVDKWTSPSEAAGIETEGTGGLQVTSGTSPAAFTTIFLRLGADADAIAGLEGSPVSFDRVAMRLSNDAYLQFAAISRGSLEIVGGGDGVVIKDSLVDQVPVHITATAEDVTFERVTLQPSALGELWVYDGGRVLITDSVCTTASGTCVEVGAMGVATVSDSTFTLPSAVGVHVWPDAEALVTVKDNVFDAAGGLGLTALQGWPDSDHGYAPTGSASTVRFEDNVIKGTGRGLVIRGGVDVTAQYNSFVQGAEAFAIWTTPDSPAPDTADLGAILLTGNCIASVVGGNLNTASAVAVDASGNWWGSATGPHEDRDNPAGMGAVIVANGGLIYDNWLKSENCAVPWRNLTPRHLEVTQVVQTWDNRVPLVAGRPAVARVWSGALPGEIDNVDMDLIVARDGANVGVLSPVASGTITLFLGMDAGTQLAIRSDPDSGIFFKVPGAWIGGSAMTFTVEINPDWVVEEYNTTDNTLSRGFAVVDRPAVHLGIVPTDYDAGGSMQRAAAPPLDTVLGLANFFARVYPSADIDVTLLPTMDWAFFEGPLRTPLYACGECAYYNTVGLNQMRLAASGGLAGTAPSAVYGAWAPEVWESGAYESFAESLFTSREAVSYGKAYGHLFAYRQLGFLGLWGTPAPLALDETPCDFYDVGYDVVRDRVVGYGHDTCSVASPKKDIVDTDRYWITLESYERLLDYTPPAPPLGTAGAGSVQDYVAVSVGVSGIDEVELLPAWQFAAAAEPHNPPVGAGAYCVELRDSGGDVLSSACFDLSVQAGNKFDWDNALVALPLSGAPARVVVRHGADEIATLPVTAHTPVVTLTTRRQALGTALAADAVLPLSWEAADADAETTLAYSILTSSDNGVTWLPVAANLRTTAFELELAEIPAGSQVWVRVEASDGFNVGYDDYGPFALENHPPEVRIQAPTTGEVLSSRPSLAGFAYDRDEGQLTGAALVWTSSIDGVLGNGALLFADHLSDGTHTLTLTATDASGARGTDTVVVTVGTPSGGLNRVYLPVVIR
jgi:hypothetical protein